MIFIFRCKKCLGNDLSFAVNDDDLSDDDRRDAMYYYHMAENGMCLYFLELEILTPIQMAAAILSSLFVVLYLRVFVQSTDKRVLNWKVIGRFVPLIPKFSISCVYRLLLAFLLFAIA